MPAGDLFHHADFVLEGNLNFTTKPPRHVHLLRAEACTGNSVIERGGAVLTFKMIPSRAGDVSSFQGDRRCKTHTLCLLPHRLQGEGEGGGRDEREGGGEGIREAGEDMRGRTCVQMCPLSDEIQRQGRGPPWMQDKWININIDVNI